MLQEKNQVRILVVKSFCHNIIQQSGSKVVINKISVVSGDRKLYSKQSFSVDQLLYSDYLNKMRLLCIRIEYFLHIFTFHTPANYFYLSLAIPRVCVL